MRPTAICVLILGLLPFRGTARTTEPLLPAPSAPTGPRVSAMPGQPIYAGSGQGFSATTQTTLPMLPVESTLSGPQAPAPPGQPIYAGQTVTQRPHYDLDPIGLRAGDFFWFPRGEVDESYNSNIFATPSSTSDLITALQPGFDLLSNFPRNGINLHPGAGLQDYAMHPSQNTATGFVSADGHLDVDEASSFYGNAQAAHLCRASARSPSPMPAARSYGMSPGSLH
ncbi:MAG: outer membrane beta-barrel protein [Stellaceae bacterium]